jgi:hypothetical protein
MHKNGVLVRCCHERARAIGEVEPTRVFESAAAARGEKAGWL